MKIFFASLFVISSLCCSQAVGPRGLSNYPNFFFVETGTQDGDGVQEALDSGKFNEMYSIEIMSADANSSRDRFSGVFTISITKGDSFLDLADILLNVNLPATFWLDAKFVTLGSAKFYYESGFSASIEPLLGELDQIKANPINTHTILINDINYVLIEFASVITITDITNKLYEINPNYLIEYVDGGNKSPLPGNVFLAKTGSILG